MKDNLTHFNEHGQAHMVDIGSKISTDRKAIAMGRIRMSELAFNLVKNQNHKKGDVIGIARIAAIMAAKKTHELIPLCHPLPLTHISVDFLLEETSHTIECQVLVKTHHNTGVEMEALTAVSAALLTVYDMCKAVDKTMTIFDICVTQKSGGKSGDFNVDNK